MTERWKEDFGMGSGEESADRRDWQRLLARWGALTAVVVACLTVTFFTAFGLASSEPGIGGDHDELLMAASVPGLYRLSMVFDAFGWLCMGGLIVIAGCALRRDAPVRLREIRGAGETVVARADDDDVARVSHRASSRESGSGVSDRAG